MKDNLNPFVGFLNQIMVAILILSITSLTLQLYGIMQQKFLITCTQEELMKQAQKLQKCETLDIKDL